AVVAHLDNEAGRKVDGIEQTEQSALRIGAGDDGFRGDLFATREQDAGNFPVFDQNLGDFGVGANFDAGFFRGGGHGGGEGAHASARVGGVPYRIGIGGSAQQKQQRGAGGPGAEGGSVDAAGGDDGSQQ